MVKSMSGSLDVSIDGRLYSVDGIIAELIIADLTLAKDHSVRQIDIVGHAGGNRHELSMQDSTGAKELILLGSDGKLHLYQAGTVSKTGKVSLGLEIKNFDALLRKKLAPGAKINFYGCHTDQMAKTVSKSYSIRTMGTPEYSWNPNHGIPNKLPATSVDLPKSWKWKDTKQGHDPGTWIHYGE